MTNGTTLATKSFIGTVAYVVGYIKGSFNELLIVLALFIVSDYICGTALALTRGEFSVRKGLYGAMKKLFYLFLVLMAFLVDLLVTTVGAKMGLSLATNGTFGMAINCYLIGTEGLSILKSLVALGLPVPRFLKKAMGILKETGEKVDIDTKEE